MWIKTHHAYPARKPRAPHHATGRVAGRKRLPEPAELEHALNSKPDDLRLGEHLVAMGRLDEDSLYEAFSLQQALPQSRIEPAKVKRAIARLLPAQSVRAIPADSVSNSILEHYSWPGRKCQRPNCAMSRDASPVSRSNFIWSRQRNYSELAKEFLQA